MNSGYKLTGFLKPYWRWIVLAPLLMTLEVALYLMQPRLIQRIVDEGIAQLNLNLIIQTGLLMMVLTVIGALGGMSKGIFAEMTVQGLAPICASSSSARCRPSRSPPAAKLPDRVE